MSPFRTRLAFAFVLAAALLLAAPSGAGAQQPAAAPQPPPAPDPDRVYNPSQPDFTLVNLQTTLRVPKYSSVFRITHRFTRPINEGNFGELLENFFGLDNGALIGLEYRFGLMRGLQTGVLRTSDRTIEFFGQYAVLRQNDATPLGLGILASIDGTNNFRDHYSPALGVALSRELGVRGAVYLEPIWVYDADTTVGDDDTTNTLIIGAALRLRIRPSVYLVGEYAPRVGFSPGVSQGSVAIEKRAGGHVFQFNISNGIANTNGQLARGSATGGDWYIGFNISRRFFR